MNRYCICSNDSNTNEKKHQNLLLSSFVIQWEVTHFAKGGNLVASAKLVVSPKEYYFPYCKNDFNVQIIRTLTR